MSEFSTQVIHRHYSKTKKMFNEENAPIVNKSCKKSNCETNGILKECDESLDLKLGQLSSSSSLSWSDEYESEITKKVFEKLRRIDRVLKQQEEFPSHYDKEEFGQWMHTFPNISIFDAEPPIDNKELLVFGRSSSRRCDKVNNKKESSVINNFEFNYNRLLTQRSGNNRKRHIDDFNTRNKNIFTISNKPKNLEIDRSLKIIPVKKQAERKMSTKSLRIRQLSKEYTESPSHFDSLPFIELEEVGSENRNPSSNFKNKKYLNHSSTLGKNSNLLILPPIHGYKLRSISATPGQDKPSKVFLI